MSTEAPAAISTVVFDLGGVLIDWDPRHLYRQLLPADEVEPFLDEIGFAEWNHEQDAGAGWDEAVERLSARHPHRRELIAAYPSRFAETLSGPIAASVDVVRELHERGVRLLALTNWSAETFPVARARFGFLDLFEDIVVSGVERVAKPDRGIFDLLVRRHGLTPEATMFVDDKQVNLNAAGLVGMVGLLFTDPPTLRADLEAAGLLPGRPG